MLSKQLNLWIENLLEIEKSNYWGNTFNNSRAAIAPYPLSIFITAIQNNLTTYC